jgi:hypothetical protein
LLNSISKQNIFAQEICHLFLDIPLYHSSRPFVSLNFNKIELRWICGTGSGSNGKEFIAIDDTGRTNQSFLKNTGIDLMN